MNRLAALLLIVAFVSQDAAAGDERVNLRLGSGVQVQVRFLRASGGNGPLPAIVVLGGLERGAAVLDLLPRTDEAVLVGFDYPVAVPQALPWTELLPLARRLERGVRETVEILARLHALLLQRGDIDGSRLSLVGVSLGAPFAVIGAAGSGYRGVVVIDGFGDLPRTVRHQFQRRWRPRYGVIGDAMAWLAQTALLQLIDLPAPEESARRLQANQRVYMLNAEQDEFVPQRSREALEEALRQSRAVLTVETVPGRHVRGDDERTIRQLYALARDWMRRQGLLDRSTAPSAPSRAAALKSTAPARGNHPWAGAGAALRAAGTPGRSSCRASSA
ncbi:MAG: hypothetical protein ISP90_04505 [Nevskia sp.]|nr:hypothetical protein [Nevskia sp.]